MQASLLVKPTSTSPKERDTWNLTGPNLQSHPRYNTKRGSATSTFGLTAADPAITGKSGPGLPGTNRALRPDQIRSNIKNFKIEKVHYSTEIEAVFNCIKLGHSFDVQKLRKSLFHACLARRYKKGAPTDTRSAWYDRGESSATNNATNSGDRKHHSGGNELQTSTDRDNFQQQWSFYAESPMTKQFTLEYILNIVPCDPIIVRTFVEKTKKQIFDNHWDVAKELYHDTFYKKDDIADQLSLRWAVEKL